jgi:hypothetical protein
MPLESGIVFQMDQTKFTDKNFFWPYRERRKNPNLDCNSHIFTRCHNQEKNKSRNFTLHFFTSDKRYNFRENAHFTGISGH